MVESTQSFGKYTLLEKVAVGGMAEIYRAKTVGMGGFEKLLAIKRLHPQFGLEHDVAKMLVDEARIAVHLSHPNIAQIFDLGCIDDQYFIAMEFINGVDLHQINKTVRERGSSIPHAALVFVMAEALSGLHYAHTRTDADGNPLQIVHRDVSPQNIMVSYEGEVKLVDFGIAKAEMRAQEETQHGIIKGKFYYMSPEQAYGHHIDARTDIFAAGMVLYELLAGHNPYANFEEYELLKAVRQADFPNIATVVPSIAPGLAEIITRATRRDANYRFESAREMQVALMDFLDRQGAPFRRLELAEYVAQIGADEPASPDESAVMSRVDYEATEASVIFEPGTPISKSTDPLVRDGQFDDGDLGENPFLEEEPTQLWTPDAPEPPAASAPSEPDSDSQPAPSDLSAPQFMDVEAFASGGGRADDKPRTEQTKLPLVERVRSAPIWSTRGIFVAVGVIVTVLGGLLAYLLLSSGGDGDAAATEEPAETASAEPVDSPTVPETVDVRVVSEPKGASIELDGQPAGTTPAVLEGVSLGEPHKIRLSKTGYATLTRTIAPTADTETLDFELEQGGAVLKVATYPPDMPILVDGEERGRSPLDVPGLSRDDEHVVVAKMDGGRTLERTISWKASDGRVKLVELTVDDERDEQDEQDEQDEPESAARRAKPRRRHRSRRPAGHRRRSSSSSSKSLDIWGDGSDANDKGSARKKAPSKSGSTSDSNGLDIWGSGSKKTAEKGVLAVRIDGQGKVYVDGKLVSGSTASINHSIAPGTYSVKVFFTTLKRYSSARRVRIRGGETKRLVFSP